MALKDLITSGRASMNISTYPGSGDPNGILQTLITACSDAIEKYCGRRFVSVDFDELYNGEGTRRLLLREYPIQKVSSVRYRPVTVLKIQNSNTALNQRATVQVTSTGLTLTRVASGVTTTDNITFAGNVTLAALASAVTALGNGWTAQVIGDVGGDYGLWPSADLFVRNSYGDPLEHTGVQQSMGALTARGCFAELKLHTYELQGYQWDARGWLLRAIPYTDPELLHPEDLVWPVGVNNFRVQYTAGYSTVPEAVQEACAEWVAMLWFLTQRDAALLQQVPSSGTSSGWNTVAGRPPLHPPDNVRALLAPYRRHHLTTNQG